MLSPEELLARLDQRLPLLTSRSRDAPARQQTLSAAIEWSHELLAAEEQELFRCLAVFQGSFSLEAADAMFDADLDALESLVEKSLVRRWGSGRFGMLDTIREYALGRLDESPDAEDVRRRHAEYFFEVADSANLNAGKLATGGQRLDLAIAEQDNIRGALAWALASGSVALALEIATAVEQFWVINDPREGMRWFEAALSRPEAEAAPADVRAHSLRAYGSSTDIAGEDEAAERLYQRSLTLFDELEDERGRAVLLHRLAISSIRRGELERAHERVEESHAIHERTGDRWGLAQTLGTLGAIARDRGEEQHAFDLIEQSATLAREVGVPWWVGGMLAELAQLALQAGRVDEAEARARESLALAEQTRDRPGRVFGVGLLAVVAAERGQPERAGRLWGPIEAEDAGAPLGGWRRHRQSCETRIRAAAGPEFERGYAEGRLLALDEAVSVALESGDA